MKHHHCSPDCRSSMAECLAHLPARMVGNHDYKELAHVLLYHLGQDHHFGLDAAAYLIDNPDFDYLKGRAGFTRGECSVDVNHMWQDPHKAFNAFSKTPFNNLIAQFSGPSIRRTHELVEASPILQDVCYELGIDNPACMCWPLKHGNYGILLYSRHEPLTREQERLLRAGAVLLGYCPVS